MSASKRRRVKSCCEAGLGSALLPQGIALISKVPLFASLSPAELPRLAAVLINVVYKSGQVVFRQGDPGNQLIIVQAGRAAVTSATAPPPDPAPAPAGEPQKAVELAAGDSYGAAALLHGAPHAATVVAAEELTLWVLERSDFEKLGLRHRLHFHKRLAVHEIHAAPDFGEAPEPRQKSEDVLAWLVTSMLANHVLGPLLEDLSEVDVRAIVESACRITVEKGDEIFKQGDAEADLFYMVEDGTLDVFIGGRFIRKLSRGSSFGEAALLFWEPRSATVQAAEGATLWAIPRQDLRQITQGPLRQRLAQYASMLKKVSGLALAAKREQDWLQLADALVEMTFFKGEYVVGEGEARCLFLLYRGRVAVEVAGQVLRELHGEPAEGLGEFFGDQSLLEDEPHRASVRVLTDRAQVLALDRRAFLQALGLPERHVVGDSAPAPAKAEAAASGLRAEDDTVSAQFKADDLQEVGVLGWGSYAKVTLVRCQSDGQRYALKTLSKGRILQRRQVKQVHMERLVLTSTCSSFIIQLFATFRTETHLSFLMEPAMGGDLYTVCERHQLFYSSRHARFYVACALQGLEHLHERWIANRDLKLENMLLDASGYCKLADFGLAKFLVGHTYTLCGTPDYMAPEVITGAGHTRAVDWWALGVVLYGLMTGSLPFDSPRPAQVFAKAKKGIDPVLATTGFGGSRRDWTDVVKGLCRLVPSERSPARKGGGQNLRDHPWFAMASFDWKQLRQRSLPPPHVPSVRDPEDLSNFDPNPEDAPHDVPYFDPGDAWDADFDESVRGPSHVC